MYCLGNECFSEDKGGKVRNSYVRTPVRGLSGSLSLTACVSPGSQVRVPLARWPGACPAKAHHDGPPAALRAARCRGTRHCLPESCPCPGTRALPCPVTECGPSGSLCHCAVPKAGQAPRGYPQAQHKRVSVIVTQVW